MHTVVEKLKKSLENNPCNSQVHAELGLLYRKLKNYDASLKELLIALEHNPHDGQIHAQLGFTYEYMRKYGLATKELKEAIDAGIDNEEIHYSLGRVYRETREDDLSLKEFEKFIAMSPYKNEPFFQNKILNEIEITQRKTVLKSKPRGMGITLTTRCNIRCKMCEAWKDVWDIPERTVKEIVEHLPYLQHIFWQGGEVFLSDYFEELFERVASYPHVRQDINTNGLFIDEGWAKKLVRSNSSLVYSIDGVTKCTYENIRRGAKFEDLLKSIAIVNKYKDEYCINNSTSGRFTTMMNVVVMKSNYHQLVQFVDFAKKYKFDILQLTPIQRVMGPENIFLNKDQKAADYIEKFMPEVIRKARNYGIMLNKWLPSIKNSICTISQSNIQEKEEKTNCLELPIKIDGILCYWPWQHLFIESGERVRPHCYCAKGVGNVYKNSLDEIWNSEMMQVYRQKLLENDYYSWCDHKCVFGVVPREDLSFNW